MERIAMGGDLAASPRRRASKQAEAKAGRLAKTNPRPRAVNRSSRADAFAAFSDELRRDLNPRGPLERLMADHVVHSAWRLRLSLDRQAAGHLRQSTGPDAEGKKGLESPSTDKAARSVRDALESLDFLRDRRTQSVPMVAAFEGEFEPNEWPIVPTDGLDDFLADPEPIEDETPSWRDRLVFDFDVSDTSPVVKGTWITVGHVVSLIVDGWAWSDILRSHPELTEEDIRTCVAFAMAEENSAN
jgi:uncharacterized protein (DUF433 family)